MVVTWELVENSALRRKKFEQSTTTSLLESFIKEYPDSAEGIMARSNIFKMADTSKEISILIEKYHSWPEAADANKTLRELQDSEFKKARHEDSVWGYERFIDNFGGTDQRKYIEQAQKLMQTAKARDAQIARDAQEQWERDRPRREARDLCRAQVNTCVASCPRAWSDTFKTYLEFPDYSCKSRCETVTCD